MSEHKEETKDDHISDEIEEKKEDKKQNDTHFTAPSTNNEQKIEPESITETSTAGEVKTQGEARNVQKLDLGANKEIENKIIIDNSSSSEDNDSNHQITEVQTSTNSTVKKDNETSNPPPPLSKNTEKNDKKEKNQKINTYYSNYNYDSYNYQHKNNKSSKYSDNVYFYKNELRSRPDHKLIEEMHKEWFGDYYTLESKHGYIQWLFPLFERGVNWDCPPLRKEDVTELLKDEKAMSRLIKSLKVMLDFYGMRIDEEKMIVYDSENSKSRYDHLNHSYHNYLRISRILTCLEIFEKHDYALAFLKHLYWECFIEENLMNASESCKKFWTSRVKDCKDWCKKSESEMIEILKDEYHDPTSYYKNQEIKQKQKEELMRRKKEDDERWKKLQNDKKGKKGNNTTAVITTPISIDNFYGKGNNVNNKQNDKPPIPGADYVDDDRNKQNNKNKRSNEQHSEEVNASKKIKAQDKDKENDKSDKPKDSKDKIQRDASISSKLENVNISDKDKDDKKGDTK